MLLLVLTLGATMLVDAIIGQYEYKYELSFAAMFAVWIPLIWLDDGRGPGQEF